MTSYDDMYTIESESIGNTQEFFIQVHRCISGSINEQELLESIFETILDDIGDENVFIFDLTIEFWFTTISKTLHISQLNSQNCSCFDITCAMQEQGINFTVPADLQVSVTKSV
ncbi:hypothetical protein DPMN_073830 [Dreissena polymorpha]|uniref:Uncharacterized protein n=1 Tax=Dreissena polymorpha TaxID=45954 RepID=A0A9D4HDX5_DREPO|nr:hypothetical protein DPMN_073830 [Dreissena polymorpha]